MTRLLTSKEIEDIISFVKPNPNIPPKTALSVVNDIKERYRKQLKQQKVYPKIIPELKQNMEKIHKQTLIQAGESVGISLAQSVGEKNTQMSVSADEKIIIKHNNKIINTTISSFTDGQMKLGKVFDLGDESIVKPTRNQDMQILTIRQDEKVQWQDITELSRHLPNGGMVKVVTESGRSVITTLSHSHLKRLNNKVIPVLSSDLKVGDRIPVVKRSDIPSTGIIEILVSDYISYDEIRGDFIYSQNNCMKNRIFLDTRFGSFLGFYLSGSKDVLPKYRDIINGFYESTGLVFESSPDILQKLMLSLCSEERKIPPFVFGSSRIFISSLLKSFTDHSQDIFLSTFIDIYSKSKDLIEQIAILLSYFGIFGKVVENGKMVSYCIYEEEYIKIYFSEIGTIYNTPKDFRSCIETMDRDILPYISRVATKLDMKGRYHLYCCYERNNWDISRDMLGKFIDIFENTAHHKKIDIDEDIGFLKQAYLSDVVWDRIVTIEPVDYKYKYVYDFSIDSTESFALQTGIIVHNTLNTFHHCGISEKAVTAGVPRFQELLNTTRDPRIVNCKVYFKEGNNSIEELRNTIGNSLVGLTFGDVCESMEVCMYKGDEKWYHPYSVLYGDEFRNYRHCIRLKLNMNKLYEFRMTMDYISDFIHSEFGDLFCVLSPPQFGLLDIFVDTSEIKLPENRLLFIDTENAPEIYMEECVMSVLEKTLICGIEKIKEIYYTQEDDEWFVETSGCDFKSILAHPLVDDTRTFSNDVWDIYETLGIEATRYFLIEEFMNIMEGINRRHTELLVDRMTHTGTINSISRYTLRKDESGPFGKASFEETVDNFLNAAAQGDIETTRGVSASIICGKRAKIGTGMVKLKMDIENLSYSVEEEKEEKEEIDEEE